MSSVTPIPIASLGANPDVAKEIQNLLLPEYDGKECPFPFPSFFHSPKIMFLIHLLIAHSS
jgi:hypothetical protein